MSHYRSGLTAYAVAALLLGGAASAHAAVTTPACLAKKLKAWVNLRKCQGTEAGKGIVGKPTDLPKCQTKFDANLAKVSAQATAAAIACRYGVNGDGTATDYDTGLQWEQKDALDGTRNPADPHDADNTYTWCVFGPAGPVCANPSNPPDGTAFTGFLGTLNNGTSSDGAATSGCFAGHCDWRLPAIEELAGIVDLNAPGCSTVTGPCIDQTVFGPTAAAINHFYWSATTDAADPGFAWRVFFDHGFVGGGGGKSLDNYVRGVRSSL